MVDWLWKAKRARKRAERANQEARDRVQEVENAKVSPPEAWWYDPLAEQLHFGGDVPDYFHPGTFGLPYDVLDAMSKVSVIAPILKRRCDQIAEFCTPQQSRYSIGLKVRLRDPKEKMTRAGEKTAREIETMIMRAGGDYGNGSFEAFTRAVMWDSLVYDQLNFEVIRERGGRPYGMRGVDAKTMRLAKLPKLTRSEGQYDPNKIKYVQHLPRQQKVVAEFEKEDMAWGIRHPRTDIDVFGYGNPELGQMTSVVRSLLNAEMYNDANFTNGIHVSTILALKSAMEPQTFRAVKRYLRALLTGPRNAKKTPLIKLDPDKNEELKSINLSMSAKDMEFSNHVNFKIKLICAMYGIDPSEIGFVFGAEGVTSALSQGGPRDRLNYSKESGLRPLVRFYQRVLNQMLVWCWEPWESFMVELAGLDSISEKEKVELLAQEVAHWKTVDEARAEMDLKERGDEVGGLILSPQAIQITQMLMQQEQAEAAGGEDMGGLPGEDMGGLPGEEEGGLPGEEEGGGAFQVAPGSTMEEAGEAAEKALSGVMRRALERGQILSKAPGGRLPRPGKRWALVDATEPGVSAWMVEVPE